MNDERATRIYDQNGKLSFHSSGPDTEPAAVITGPVTAIVGEEATVEGCRLGISPDALLMAARNGMWKLQTWSDQLPRIGGKMGTPFKKHETKKTRKDAARRANGR